MNAFHVLFQLGSRAGTYQHAGYAFLVQNPRQCHFGKGFATFACFRIPLLQLLQEFRGQGAVLQEVLLCHAAIGWDAVEIMVGEETLGEGREGDESDAVFVAVVEGSVLLWCTVEHVESVLEDEQRTVALLQIGQQISGLPVASG